MNEVKIFFIIIGTFFMREQPSLVAEKAVISVDPIKKQVVIVQKNLISTVEEQSVAKTEEFQKLKNKELHWVNDLNVFKNKEVSIQENGNSVSLTVSFTYDKPEDLSIINIDYSESKFSTFIDEKIKGLTGDFQIEEPYLVFKGNTPFSFEVSIYDEWLESDTPPLQFNKEFLGQPLVMKKSDAVKGKTLTQTDTASVYGTTPNYIDNGLNLFFAEDQDFVLVNEETEVEVRYFDNNTLLIPITEGYAAVKGLNKGDNYFVFNLDEMNNNLTLFPSDKAGNILKDKKPLYFSTMPEE
ncbi:hypothetical protein [Sphingobacterium mizutaii]|uniref:hypothetical protein n=1 Tax=Sphingobacterium mizutaii TaxID=1010 RepID=UPI0028AE020B|nr:hypothetical protein [Sphingobacterium mizutaii]